MQLQHKPLYSDKSISKSDRAAREELSKSKSGSFYSKETRENVKDFGKDKKEYNEDNNELKDKKSSKDKDANDTDSKLRREKSNITSKSGDQKQRAKDDEERKPELQNDDNSDPIGDETSFVFSKPETPRSPTKKQQQELQLKDTKHSTKDEPNKSKSKDSSSKDYISYKDRVVKEHNKSRDTDNNEDHTKRNSPTKEHRHKDNELSRDKSFKTKNPSELFATPSTPSKKSSPRKHHKTSSHAFDHADKIAHSMASKGGKLEFTRSSSSTPASSMK